jgi:hypothetical protein
VIGVMPKSFRIADLPAAIIAPLQLDRTRAELSGFFLNSIGRLRHGVSLDQAQADIARLIPIWMHSWDSNAIAIQVFGSWRIAPNLRPLHETIVGDVGDVR